MYDNSYECIETYTDNGGRIAIAVVKGEIEKCVDLQTLVLLQLRKGGICNYGWVENCEFGCRF